MSLFALLLIITAAVLHATWNLVTKKVAGGMLFYWLVSLIAAVLYLPFVYLQLKNVPLSLNMTVIIFAFTSAVLHLLYFVVLQAGYRKADLSVVYPVTRGAGPLFSVIGAVLLFHEKPGVLAIAGILLIITGVILMTGLKFRKGAVVGKGVYYGLLTGVFVAAYTLWDKAAVVDYQVSAIFITFATIIFPLLLLLPVCIKQYGELKIEVRTHWKQAAAVAICQPLSYLLVLFAMKTTPVTYVAPAREMSIVFGVFFGARLLKEPDNLKRMLAALIILVGIALLALG